MARGHQKIQSQQRNAKKQAEQKKAKGHDQKTAAKAALVFTCSVCKVRMGLTHEQKGLSISISFCVNVMSCNVNDLLLGEIVCL